MQSYDLVCLSHLRWDFVFQRPQHLLTRFQRGRVLFFEEPIFDSAEPRLDVSPRGDRVRVLVPHLPAGLSEEQIHEAQAALLSAQLEQDDVQDYVLWYYTPSSLEFSRQLRPLVTVYDCMDELSHFKNAPAGLREQEQELFARADLVFTGGYSLYNFKRNQHPNVHPFPSSVDVNHFIKARVPGPEPADQATIPHPRVGYFGVIDERLDLELLRQLAADREDLQLVMVGPLCKIEEADLPRAHNIHYLGPKSYQELPTYLSGWDVAMMPFARNDATRFISPTKTPEYLAGGKPVVSTSIADVIDPYDRLNLVRIADLPGDFSHAVDQALAESPVDRLLRADEFLASNSWDSTWERMQALVEARLPAAALRE